MVNEFKYSRKAIDEACHKAIAWYDLIKLQLFDKFAMKKGVDLISNPDDVGHTINWARAIVCVIPGTLRDDIDYKTSISIVDRLAEYRKLSTDRGDNQDYKEMQRYMHRVLIEKFIYELGGEELMEAVLAKQIDKGNWTERMVRDFGCMAAPAR